MTSACRRRRRELPRQRLADDPAGRALPLAAGRARGEGPRGGGDGGAGARAARLGGDALLLQGGGGRPGAGRPGGAGGLPGGGRAGGADALLRADAARERRLHPAPRRRLRAGGPGGAAPPGAGDLPARACPEPALPHHAARPAGSAGSSSAGSRASTSCCASCSSPSCRWCSSWRWSAAILFFVFDVWYLVVVAVTIWLYVWFTFKLTEWRLAIRARMNERDTDANQKAVDSLLNFETVKYFNAEEREAARYDALDAGLREGGDRDAGQPDLAQLRPGADHHRRAGRS